MFTLLLTPFASKLVNYTWHSEYLKIDKPGFEGIDQFGRKRYQKKREDVSYKASAVKLPADMPPNYFFQTEEIFQ